LGDGPPFLPSISNAAISKIPKHKTADKIELIIHSDRILELKNMFNSVSDLSRLIGLLEELNFTYIN